jgi:hypothetical protein
MFKNIVALLAVGFVVTGTIQTLKYGFSPHHGQLLLLIGVVLALVAIFLPKYSAKKDKPEKKKP